LSSDVIVTTLAFKGFINVYKRIIFSVLQTKIIKS
jgi:hypothetical protein